ncbi:MAG: glycosyltransferase [Pleurocapsa sp. MO_192.B19]|nr:glycosyltransferase [Pleurocapsa sp. MO_192.B19]
MKIAICTIGSRGDVQPFFLLGNALAKSGHVVRLSTAEMYSPLAAKYSVEFVPFTGDYGALVDSDEMKKVIGSNPFTIGKRLREKIYPIIENSLETFFEVSSWADVVVYHPKCLVDSFGVLFPEKLIKAYVVPVFTPTQEFPSPVFSGLSIPAFLNKLSFRMTNALISTVKSPVNAFCSKQGLSSKFKFIDTPTLYGISRNFIPQPLDYPPHHHFTGFWFDDTSSSELPVDITSFFETSKQKLIITFGSMPYKSKIDINEFISALLAELDVRVAIVRGWGLKDALITESDNVLAIDHAPFDKLFPLADGIVHHGGAGTTAIALKSGIPMMICPVLYPFGDQMFWGKRVCQTRLGVAPIPLSKLTVNQFVRAVRALLEGNFSKSSLKMQSQIAQEDGLTKAVKLIEQRKDTLI